MNKLVLLPSAKLVPLELQSEFGRIPSAMIPLDSRPALHYVSEYYQRRNFDLLVGVHEKAKEVHRYCADHPDLHALITDVGPTSSLGETILRSLESLDDLPEYLVVNFADTCIGDELTIGNFVCYSNQDDVFRWTTFQLDETSRIARINERWTEKTVIDEPLHVFVGIFGFDNVPTFIAWLSKYVQEKKEADLDPFYLAVQAYFNDLSPNQKKFHSVQEWWDFGHLDTYYSTKKQIALNCRYFNRVSVDCKRGIIHKTSTEAKKLLNEIKWYLKLPKGLQHVAPRIFDYNLSFEQPFLDLEFYGYPALNDMYLYGDYDIGVWNQIFVAIESTLDDMGAYRLEPKNSGDLLDAMQSMYEGKTVARLKTILDDDRFAVFCGEKITINGEKVYGLGKALNLLPEVIERIDLYDQQWFSIIHGDLCLSNILYDNRNRIVRFIDPRGGFGNYDIYGDPRYDIAKLSHSIEGDYDFLVNGLFDLSWNNGALEFSIHHQERHLAVKELFRKKVIENWRVNYAQMKLIESLLFLSMVPLHADRYLSQQAFLARGLQTFWAVAADTSNNK